MSRRVIEKLILLLFGLALPVAMLIGTELVLRTFPALLPPPIRAAPKAPLLDMFQSDPLRIDDDELVSRFRAGVVMTQTNELGEIIEFRTASLGFSDVGFRDDGLDERKLPRVVVLGDSFAEGANVNLQDGSVELLEQSTGADFVNLGVGGYGATQARIVLERYGLELKPALVILMFFTGNDLGDDGIYESKTSRSPGDRLKQFLEKYFYTYELLKHVLGRSSGASSLPLVNEVGSDDLAYRDEELDLVFYLEHFASLVKDDPPAWIARGMQRTPQSILQIRDICQARGIEFVVVIAPSKEQVYWEKVASLLAEPDRYDPDGPNRLIKNFADEHGIAVLDLTPIFRAHADEQLYFPKDTHWNVAGNRLAAQAMSDYLLTNGLLTTEHREAEGERHP